MTNTTNTQSILNYATLLTLTHEVATPAQREAVTYTVVASGADPMRVVAVCTECESMTVLSNSQRITECPEAAMQYRAHYDLTCCAPETTVAVIF